MKEEKDMTIILDNQCEMNLETDSSLDEIETEEILIDGSTEENTDDADMIGDISTEENFTAKNLVKELSTEEVCVNESLVENLSTEEIVDDEKQIEVLSEVEIVVASQEVEDTSQPQEEQANDIENLQERENALTNTLDTSKVEKTETQKDEPIEISIVN